MKITSLRPYCLGLLSLLALGLALSGCGDGQQQAQMPPPMVKAMTLEPKDQPLTFEYMGQTAGAREIDVTARTGGILLERKYMEGSFVDEGDLLFTIDPEKSDANLAQYASTLASARATLENSRRERDRIVKLYKDGAISAQERDDAVTAYETALANVQESEAKVRDARIDLKYNEVRAPIAGVTSKEAVSEGSLVIANSSVLTTIIQLDPFYVNFSMPGAEALRNRRWLAEGKMSLPEEGYSLELRLVDGSMYAPKGFINFSDTKVDPQTGSIRVRGQFPNPEMIVLPGQYVRVFVKGAVLNQALLVPQRAVLFTQQGPIAYVLDKDNVATPHPLTLGIEVGEDFVVEAGLKPGDRIVSEGVIKVRPGTPVNVAPDQPADGGKAAPAEGKKDEAKPEGGE
ncbi:efflux RND transporter periplasmic adaptor subunit [Paucidesulfovibrio longus]|uniref:efflux RND transporter periplasmic adaptor subunit n=1 Tax=Paucidesulfovibrio longus TaxID=889 RepID=UPI0003B412AD|nr:efflux RND transporter periplasmic adaptor subunit [Paucidesulfovibrio longus]